MTDNEDNRSVIRSIASAARCQHELGEMERWLVAREEEFLFCRAIASAWEWQERGVVDYGLRSTEVDAIVRQGRWLRYEIEDAWYRYDAKSKQGIGPPSRPDCTKPVRAELPQWPDLRWSCWQERVGAYVAYCRRRAGLGVEGRGRLDAVDPYEVT